MLTIERTGNIYSIASSEFRVTYPDGHVGTIWSPPWHEMPPEHEQKAALKVAADWFASGTHKRVSLGGEDNASAPKCPKCGQDMGVETRPDAGALWCGSIKCGFSIGRDAPIEDVRAYLAANNIHTKPALDAVLLAINTAASQGK